MTPAEKDLLTKLLAVKHPTTPKANRFRLRKGSTADFNWAIESRGQALSPPKKTGTVTAFGEDLKPFAGEDSGGMFVEFTAGKYERPIVYLSSEGDTYIAAASAREMFGLLPYCGGDGWGFMDAITAVGADMQTLEVERAEKNPRSVLDGPRGTVDDETVQLLAGHDVPLVADPVAAIEAANRKFLWAFIDRIDMIVTGFTARHTWFNAWSAPGADLASARAFSPKERYAVGERLTYQHRADSPALRGVVLGHPQANRVLIGDRRLVVLRAYN